MTSTSLGSMPAWAMASLAAFTISDSLVSPSSLPNFPCDHPTIQAVMERSFATSLVSGDPRRRGLAGRGHRLYVHIHIYCLAVLATTPAGDLLMAPPVAASGPPKFRRSTGIDCHPRPEPNCPMAENEPLPDRPRPR